MRRRAFALIELLVVIATLAAILFPVFAQAKGAARRSTGVAHVKQQNLACVTYSDDAYPLDNVNDWGGLSEPMSGFHPGGAAELASRIAVCALFRLAALRPKE